LEILRIIGEIPGKPLSWLYLKRDGRNLLKKAIRQQARGVTALQRRATLIKLIAIGKRAATEADIRNMNPQVATTPVPLVPQQAELEQAPINLGQ
jgi:hypothetical protein